jgi:hypothetical protein
MQQEFLVEMGMADGTERADAAPTGVAMLAAATADRSPER